MTDAKSTRDSSNSPNGSETGEQKAAPAAPKMDASNHGLPGRIERPPLKVVSDRGVSTTISSLERLGRRHSSTQRKRGGIGAAKESRRVPSGDRAKMDRRKRMTGEASPERMRRRSRKSAALTLAEGNESKGAAARGAVSKSAVPKSGAVAGKPFGRKPAPPNLGLARRRNVRRKTPVPLLYMGRLAIAGLGLAVISGTFLRVLPNGNATTSEVTGVAAVSAVRPAARFPITLGQEIAPLKSELQELPNLYPDLSAKAFYIDVETGNYVDLEGGDSVAAASTIKLPILLAFFEDVDKNLITFDQTLAIAPKQIAKGSGDMQISPPGTQFTALEVATQMIVSSDNTATNMMIDLLGGPAVLNERFKRYGLQKTQISSPLPDLEGTNTTSAKDLVHTMLLISSENRLTTRSRDRILNILNRTHNKSLLAEGMIAKEALTYNKTGDIESMLGDIALVDLSNGKRYIVAAMVERPSNDGRAAELIHRISGRTYQEADEAIRPAVTPLGAPETVSPEAASASPERIEGTDATAPIVEEPVMKEEPYPSANP